MSTILTIKTNIFIIKTNVTHIMQFKRIATRNSIKLFIHNPCGDYRSKHLLVKKINIINFDIPRKKKVNKI